MCPLRKPARREKPRTLASAPTPLACLERKENRAEEKREKGRKGENGKLKRVGNVIEHIYPANKGHSLRGAPFGFTLWGFFYASRELFFFLEYVLLLVPKIRSHHGQVRVVWMKILDVLLYPFVDCVCLLWKLVKFAFV